MPEPVGFFTDTSICIGCKACEVACKEWNQLPGHAASFLDSFDNTGRLDEQNWRHVQFHDRVPDASVTAGNGHAWLMMSDVCKHCKDAPCLEVCPTGAIVRTEFDTVLIQQHVCNGNRECISACPFSAIGFSEETGTARKCTFCYDRLQNGLMPACAQACPTQSIQFGPLSEMRKRADARLEVVRSQGNTDARLYGRDDQVYGGLNAFFLLMDKPETYRLPAPRYAVLPSRNNRLGYLGSLAAAVMAVLGGLIALRNRRVSETEPSAADAPGGAT